MPVEAGHQGLRGAARCEPAGREGHWLGRRRIAPPARSAAQTDRDHSPRPPSPQWWRGPLPAGARIGVALHLPPRCGCTHALRVATPRDHPNGVVTPGLHGSTIDTAGVVDVRRPSSQDPLVAKESVMSTTTPPSACPRRDRVDDRVDGPSGRSIRLLVDCLHRHIDQRPQQVRVIVAVDSSKLDLPLGLPVDVPRGRDRHHRPGDAPRGSALHVAEQ